MKYDFTTVVNRKNTGALKWEAMYQIKPDVNSDVVPLSVADMEFKNPPEVVEGLREYMSDDLVLGYTGPTEAYHNAVKSWMKRRHNWDIQTDWIVNSPGVVSAFFAAVAAFSEPGDGIIIMTPVYYPFYNAISRNERTLVSSSLVDDGEKYHIDFADLEEKAKDPRNKVLLFCSPHNPVGRVWSREELEKVAKICSDNNVVVVSDEIHFDLIMPGYRHTVFATISEEAANNCIVCTAPSKTFNLAGLHTSNIIIPNEDLRKRFSKEQERSGFFSLNIFGYKGCELAYEKSEAWLEELLQVIDTNRRLVEDFMAEKLPKIKVYNMEGTYLQWWDCRALGMDDNQLETFMQQNAQLFLDEGYIFGKEGSGFERINLACPTSVLQASLNRLEEAFAAL